MNIKRLPDAVDLRRVFRVYAWLAWVIGGWTALWGSLWLATPTPQLVSPFFGDSLVRVAGAGIFAAGCVAAGFARVEDGESRRRGILWFGIAHTVVLVIVVIQWRAIWGHGVGDLAVFVLLTSTLLLFYFWQTGEGHVAGETMAFTALFGGPKRPPIEQLRSEYEQRIREAAGQEERNRLARELHDSIKQQLFVIQTAAATAQARFGSDATGARDALEQVRSSSREAMTEMEALLDQLRAAPLENAGLVEALKKQCEALAFRTGIKVEVEVGTLPPNEALPPGAQQAVFRVAQEALSNVARHARASEVRVRLDSGVSTLTLSVDDNGTGFEPPGKGRGMGLGNMRARAAAYGGTVQIKSAPGAGTSVTLSMPCEAGLADWSEYRRRARNWAAVAALLAGIVVWDVVARWRIETIGFDASLAVVAVIIFLRALVVYLRVRNRKQAAPWEQSPSHS